MKFRIGYRTIKSAIGATAAISLAQYFGLQNAASAGILTILCIQVTKRKSLQASWERILSCLIGIVFSVLFFEGIAYHPLVIGLLLLFFIPTVVMLKASEGIVSSTVIVFHFFSEGTVSTAFVLNEIAIILIGIGMALLVNTYMPSVDHKIIDYQNKIEANFKKIFLEIVRYLREGDNDWDGREIPETVQLLDEAKLVSIQVMENRFLHHDDIYYTYFSMREKQFEIIERVLPIITSISDTVTQGKMIASFIEELAFHIHGGNTAIIYLDQLSLMKTEFEKMELPKTREEFEIRAALLHFIKEMEQYLIIKRAFKGLDEKKTLKRVKAH
nr:aromatic acid exporter family protein [uncultured Bacillus sp.]